MKIFEDITVLVEYCYPEDGSGDEIPVGHRIHARVAETRTPAGGVCRAFGTELTGDRKYTDHDMGALHVLCLRELRGLTQYVTFVYDLPLGLMPERYPVEVS